MFIGLVLLCVLAAGVRLRAAWLPRVVVAAGVATMLGLVAVNPDALSGLSVDAVDAIDRLPEPRRSCILAEITRSLPKPEPWSRIYR